MLIVNADDFGYATTINASILESFEKGLISSTTIMANMPGFDEACILAHDHRLLDHVGIHINLTEGLPLTDKMKRCGRFCDRNGYFKLRNNRMLHLSLDERWALADEVHAQIKRVRKSGIPITHLDSHHRIHEEIGIVSVIIMVMRGTRIPYLRLCCNYGKMTSVMRRIYRHCLNLWIRSKGLARTRTFGSIIDYDYFRMRNGAVPHDVSCEIMVHPKYNDQGQLIDSTSKWLLTDIAQRYNLCGKIVSFSGHHYQ